MCKFLRLPGMGILRLYQPAFRQIRRLSIFSAIIATSLHSADNGLAIANPRLGSVLDEQSNQLRLVEGIPGSAALGGVITAGTPIEQAWIVPQAKRALVRFVGQSGLAVIDWNGSPQILQAEDLKFEGAPVAAISPSGKAFGLFANGGLESWRIGASGLIRLWRANLNSENNPSSLAISDDGELVAAALPGRVVVVQAGAQSAATIAETESFGAMSFAHDSHSFVLGPESSNAVLLFDSLPGRSNVEIQWESTQPERLAGVGFSGDNAFIATASSTDTGGQIRLFTSSDGRAKAVFETRTTPNGIFRANGNAVFQLTTSAKATNSMLDGDVEEPRLVTVAGQEISND